MSNALAIAGVTAVLKDLLNDGLIDNDITTSVEGNVKVTVLPPDRVRSSGTGEQADADQLNLFLYQVTPNAGWRNAGLPSRDSNGARLSNAPLGLDLHYLLTAYGANEFNAEILLGYAMQILHETPVLPREKIRATLAGSTLPGSILPANPRSWRTLSAHELADQVEQIKITPASLSTEEISRLWSAMQTRYRTTAAYHVSVVLIEARQPTRAALPVLTRGPVDPSTRRELGAAIHPDLIPPYPILIAVRPPDLQTTARLGDVLALEGRHLDGSDRSVRLSTARLTLEFELVPRAGGDARIVELDLPQTQQTPVPPTNPPLQLPAGIYTAAVLIQWPGETYRRTTNEVPFSIAPVITTLLPIRRTLDAQRDVSIELTCEPEVQPRQRVSLILGDQEILANDHSSPTNNLRFIGHRVAPNRYLARLRVDGIDSALQVDRNAASATFNQYVGPFIEVT